jgi:Tol biopolymer transport system component
MSVSAGSRLGPYQVIAAIGAGGMGEVYKAHDTRLDRDVALKVLPSVAALDPERLRRFEQEARAAAALNDPHILAVFDVGADGGVNYVVSELLEGETLRERLNGGPLPLRKAIDYAEQIARGLATAHAKGIVHRDLKPENLFVTRDGRVKILDFGIAKLTGTPEQQSIAPTIERGTTPGTVLGTVGYMSPEQVRGLSTDPRTDIFSFGAILYEMLSGRRAFARATSADTMSAILNADPPELNDPQRVVPPILDRLVRRCVEKSPDERFQSARDLAFDLEAISTTSHATGSGVASESPRRQFRLSTGSALVSVALAAGIGAATTWMVTTRARVAGEPAAFEQLTFQRGTISAARFSPDGQTIVYSAGWEGRPQELYATRAGSIGARPLGIEGELQAISSSGEIAVLRDVRRIQNWAQTGTLALAPSGGGAPKEILRNVGGADWSPDGQQLAITRFLPEQGRWRLEYPVGTVLLDTPNWIERPRVSRDGKLVLLLEHPPYGDSRGRVVVISGKGQRTELTPEYPSLVGAAWSPTGDEAWFTASPAGNRLTLFGIKSGARIRAVAPMAASVIVEDVLPGGRTLIQTMSMKARMLVKTPADAEERDISWFDYPQLGDMSPDGSTILFNEQGEGGGANYTVFIRRTDGAPAIRLGIGFAGRLSPDLQWVTSAVPRDPPSVLRLLPIGAGDARTLTLPIDWDSHQWFPDGKRLLIGGNEPGRKPRGYEYQIESGKIRPVTPEGIVPESISPDGRTVIARAADRAVLYPLEGGQPREVRGVAPDDVILRWAIDGSSIFTATAVSPRTWTISRVDLADGRHGTVATVGPSDAAISRVSIPLISADGRTYAYRYGLRLSDLFQAEGLR